MKNENDPLRELLRAQTKLWPTIWRNFLAGLARGAGYVTIIIILLIILTFIFQ